MTIYENLTQGPRCHNFFAVYDVSRPDTFESLNSWLEEVEQFACSGGRGDKKHRISPLRIETGISTVHICLNIS